MYRTPGLIGRQVTRCPSIQEIVFFVGAPIHLRDFTKITLQNDRAHPDIARKGKLSRDACGEELGRREPDRDLCSKWGTVSPGTVIFNINCAR